MIRKEQPKMANEFEPRIELQDMGTDTSDVLHPDSQPMTYERDSARAEVMAHAEDDGRMASKRFAELALKAADNIEAGKTQPVSHKYVYEWDPPFSEYKTEWKGIDDNYDESDKAALAAIAMSHPNKEKLSGEDPMKENSKIQLSHEEVADAAIGQAQAGIERASRAAERAGEQYDEKKQEAANKASDVRSRIARL